MKRISDLTPPALAGVVREYSKNAVLAEIKNCIYHGADMIDLHMSCMEDSSVGALRDIVKASSLPILALNYNMNEKWEPLGLTEEERVEYFKRAVEAGAAGVDMQGYTFHAESKIAYLGDREHSFASAEPCEVVTDKGVISKQCELIEWVHERGAEVLLSCHPARVMSCEQVVDLALFLEKRNPDVIKLVTLAETEDELIESFKTMRALKKEVKTAVSFHVGGSKGDLSRIINPMLGSHMIFCVDSFKATSTMGQLHLETARDIIDKTRKIGTL